MNPSIIAVQGSMQLNSATEVLVRRVADLLERNGAQVTHVDLRTLQLPLFEEGAAKTVAAYCSIASLIRDADGYVLGTPDYHGNPSGALKNFLDYFWREFTGKLFGYICLSQERGTTAMDALRIAVRQCYGWSLPYGVSASSRNDLGPAGEICSRALNERLEMMASDMARYAGLLALERRSGLDGSYPTFMAALRPRPILSQAAVGV
jgi:NAD(P)H-dependent FMN reductase